MGCWISKLRMLVLAGALLGTVGPLLADDFSTQVMSATFMVVNPKSNAAAFVLSRPKPGKPDQFESVLVTAAHVFEQAEGNEVTLQLRSKKGEVEFQKVAMKLEIRANGKPLWSKHPTADVAAIRISPPKEADIAKLSVNLLAGDAAYKKFEIHPGDRIMSCGYPHQVEANAAGFPLLRAGTIASYPLLPAKTVKSYFAELNTFEGDSGSPVFFDETNRFFDGKVQPNHVQLIVGIIIGEGILRRRSQDALRHDQSSAAARLGRHSAGGIHSRDGKNGSAGAMIWGGKARATPPRQRRPGWV